MAYKATITVILSGDEGQSLQVIAASHRIESIATAGGKVGLAVQKALEEAVGFGDAQRQRLAAAQTEIASLKAAVLAEKSKAVATATAPISPVYVEEKHQQKKYKPRAEG